MAVTLTANQVIDLIDLLQVASIACEATAMASEALRGDHQDAITYLARDTQNTVEAARSTLDKWREAAVEANRQGNGNG